jgi:electron transfer flavoprotein alpha subunit
MQGDIMSENIPVLVSDDCDSCGICVESCPFSSIKIIEGKAVIGEGCRVCGICVDVCPQGAISIKDEEIREDLGHKGVLVFVEHRKGNTHPVAYELLGKGKQLAETLMEPLYAVIIGYGLDKGVKELTYRGAEKVFAYDDPFLENFRIDPYTEILSSLLVDLKPNIVLIGATAIGRALGPRVAARLKTGLTADCTGLEIDSETGLLLQTRPAYGGNIMATIITPKSRPQMATVRYKVMDEAPRDETLKSEIINKSVEINKLPDRVKVLDFEPASEEVSIVEAGIIVSGGKGLQNPEGFKVIEELAKELQAAVGASRPTVDEGWINYRHQVGLSGRTVRPQIYFACGISGAVQHLAGMKTSETIISLNKDPNAPIFNVSTIGAVGDLYEVIPRLIKKIREYKGNE